MSFDDKPYYLRETTIVNGKPLGSNEPVIPKPKNWGGTHKNASSPSTLLSWWMHEDAKRRKGQINEHDTNEMLAALKGVKNAWYKAVQSEKARIEAFLKAPTDAEWQSLKPLKTVTHVSNKLFTGTNIQSQMAERQHAGSESVEPIANREENIPPPF